MRRGPHSGLPSSRSARALDTKGPFDAGGAKDDAGDDAPRARPPAAPPRLNGMSLLNALAWLKDRRPIASPHPAYMAELCAWEVRWRGGEPSLNAETYRNNRYECVDKLHANISDPRSSQALLGRACRNSDGDLKEMNDQFRALARERRR